MLLGWIKGLVGLARRREGAKITEFTASQRVRFGAMANEARAMGPAPRVLYPSAFNSRTLFDAGEADGANRQTHDAPGALVIGDQVDAETVHQLVEVKAQVARRASVYAKAAGQIQLRQLNTPERADEGRSSSGDKLLVSTKVKAGVVGDGDGGSTELAEVRADRARVAGNADGDVRAPGDGSPARAETLSGIRRGRISAVVYGPARRTSRARPATGPANLPQGRGASARIGQGQCAPIFFDINGGGTEAQRRDSLLTRQGFIPAMVRRISAPPCRRGVGDPHGAAVAVSHHARGAVCAGELAESVAARLSSPKSNASGSLITEGMVRA